MSEPRTDGPTAGAGGESLPGDGIRRGLWAVTVLFAASSAAAVAFPGPVRVASAFFDLALFAGGSLLLFAAFLVAVGRSRTEEVTVAGTFFLSGTAPAPLRRQFLLLLTAQCVIALVAASLRPYTAVAFAVLAPMSAFGAMAWWGARYGPAESKTPSAPD